VKKIDKIIKRTWIISQQKLHTRIKNDMLYSPIHFIFTSSVLFNSAQIDTQLRNTA